MRAALLAASSTLAALCALARPAAADGLYFSEAFGGTHIGNELGAYLHDATRIHVAFGYRGGRTSIGLWMGGDIPADETTQPGLMTFGLDVKRAFQVSPHLEAYVRGSMSRMTGEDQLDGYSGRGLGVGGGAQLKGHAPILTFLYPPIALVCLIPGACRKLGPMGTIALFFDTGYDFYRLHNPRGGHALDVDATRWTIGFALGSDF